MVMPTNYDIAQDGFTLHGRPWHFWDFRNIILPNKGEDQKQFFLSSESEAPATVMFGKSGLG